MLVQGRDAVASRYRAIQYVPFLQERGWEVSVLPHDSTLRERMRLVQRAGAADILFVQKKRLSAWQLYRIRRAGTRIVYDVDDAVMFRSSRHADRASRTRWRRFETMVRHTDLVIAGNEYLKALVGSIHPDVVVQPLAFDLAKYPPRESYEARSSLTLGWIGGAKSLTFLQALTPAFERLARTYPRLQLKIVCDAFFDLERVQVVKKPWRREDEGSDVASFDIGIAPLPDDEWARGKCGTKLLQYFCAAVPAVASPVGVHEKLIAGGRNALGASSLEDWERALRRLIEDASLRRALGRAGRRYVAAHHAIEGLAAQLDQYLLRALDRRLHASAQLGSPTPHPGGDASPGR